MPAERVVTVGPAFVLLISSLVLGGGGSPYPVMEALVQVVAALCVAAALFFVPAVAALPRRDGLGLALLALLAALVLIQLVPLPASVWSVLPGREQAARIAGVLGGAGMSHPLSLYPDRTIAAGLALLPALAMVLLTAALPVRGRTMLIVAVTALALIGGLLGLAQFGSGTDALYLYSYSNFGFADGFFANRNAQVDLIVIGAAALVLLQDRYRSAADGPGRSTIVAALGVTLLICGVATGSRTGIALLLVPIVLALLLVQRWMPDTRRWARRLVPLAIAGATVAFGVLALQTTTLSRASDRFAAQNDARGPIWDNSVFAARAAWPVGYGSGSFVPVYQSVEPLDDVDETYANRAHNDYLETLLETGAWGFAGLLAVIGFFALRGRRLWGTRDPDERLHIRFALVVLIVIAVHSLVDYPLRTLALLAVAGVALGVLFKRPEQEPASDRSTGKLRPARSAYR